MHTRQRGAAHVNIFFFLVTLVLLIGASVFAYVNLVANTELKTQVATAQASENQAKQSLEIYIDYKDDVTKVLGAAGEYAGGKDAAGNVKQYDGDPGPIKNAAHPDLLVQTMAEFARHVKVPEPGGRPNGMADMFGHVKTSFDKLTKEVTDLQAQIAQRDGQIAALEAAASNERTARQQAELALNQQITQKTEEHQTALDDQLGLLRQANQQVSQRRDELLAEQEARATENMEHAKEKEILQGRIAAAAAKIQLVNPPDAPDGSILRVSESTGLGWIDIGRQQMLPRGTTFKITDKFTGADKGFGTVTRVDEATAQIRITGAVAEIQQGDLISNDVFSPNVKRNIYLLGRFSYPETREVVSTTLRKLGHTVTNSLSPAVDLVIVGGDTINEEGSGFAPIVDSEEYKMALNLRIEIANLAKIRPFLKLGDS